MTLFLMTEVMMFAGMISACLLMRNTTTDVWPPLDQPRLPLTVTLGNMAILIASGLTLAIARGRRSWIGITLLLGAMFLAIQGYEWSRLISYGTHNIATPFAGIFYGLIGTHALHVVGGLAFLALTWQKLRRGQDLTRICTMYWTLVVAIWPVIFFMIYV